MISVSSSFCNFLVIFIYSILITTIIINEKVCKTISYKDINFDFVLYQKLAEIECIKDSEKYPFKSICNQIRKKLGFDRPKMASFIKFKMDQFRRKVRDSESLANIDFLEKSLLCAVIYRRQYVKFNSYQINHSERYKIEEPEIMKKYINDDFTQEVFYFHNGLRFASNKVKEFIKKRDILDIGSFNGESYLMKYHEIKQYSK